jgi:hypothetical protein
MDRASGGMVDRTRFVLWPVAAALTYVWKASTARRKSRPYSVRGVSSVPVSTGRRAEWGWDFRRAVLEAVMNLRRV